MGNKHLWAAIVIAPLLALLSWYGVGWYAQEQPSPAKPGASYPLTAQSNCRYESGLCTLKNNDLELYIKVESDSKFTILNIESTHSLNQAVVGIGDDEPLSLDPQDASNTIWAKNLLTEPSLYSTLRVVVTVNDSHYYAQTSLAFQDYQTAYRQDFR
ncbi:MAG: hypothetical protein AAF197_04740 [Pseudomonadota bacterium]